MSVNCEESKTITVNINGKVYKTLPGKMLIEVADENGIYIPRFCYHKKLSIAANCRMCLVEVEGARRASPACASPIMDGMNVWTKSPETIKLQKMAMEFLLINHPLDCPICDQAGECELQDMSVGYGSDDSNYTEGKRVVKDLNLGGLVATDFTRCIQCSRCVRFGREIAGDQEIGLLDRGEHSHISTYVDKTLDSELSGNIIDICPVGALTSKPYSMTARAWELKTFHSISPHDGVGSALELHLRRNKVMRVVASENEILNETWISDRDRFSYLGLNSKDRIHNPKIKKNNSWVDVSWEEALDFIKVSLEKTIQDDGADKIGAIASENSTVEELYVFQKLMRSLGCNNIDSRIKQNDLNGNISSSYGLNCSMSEIENSDFILLVGSNLRKEQPIVNLRVKKTADNDAKVISINSQEYDFNYNIKQHVVDSVNISWWFASFVKAIYKRISITESQKLNFLDKLLASFKLVKVSTEIDNLAKDFLNAKSPLIMLGSIAVTHDNFSEMMALFLLLNRLINTKGGVLSIGTNTKGAELAGFLPYKSVKNNTINGNGLNAKDILVNKNDIKTLLLLDLEPESDSVYGESTVLNKLSNIDIVISFNNYFSKNMAVYSDIILPTESFLEKTGKIINFSGIEQKYSQIIKPEKNVKPVWKVFRVLGNLMNIAGFDYNNLSDISHEINNINNSSDEIDINKILPNSFIKKTYISLEYQVEKHISMYHVDSLVRRSDPLQETKDSKIANCIYFPSMIIKKMNLKDSQKMILKVNSKSYDILESCTLASHTIIVPSDYDGKIDFLNIQVIEKSSKNKQVL